MDLAIDKNMIDKDEYPQTAEIERRCVHMLADLWNAPESANTVGASAIGSSEACMLGGWRPSGVGEPSGRQPADQPIDRTWCADRSRSCGTSSPSTGTSRCVRCRCRRATTRWTLTTCWHAPTRTRSWSCPRSGSRTPAPTSWSSRSRRRPRRAAGRHGTRRRHPRRRRQRCFLALFCAPDIEWDFRLPRVKSISTSGHKFGLAPLGVGWVVWRDLPSCPTI